MQDPCLLDMGEGACRWEGGVSARPLSVGHADGKGELVQDLESCHHCTISSKIEQAVL